MSKHRNTFPNGSKVIPIRFDPVVELMAKEEACRMGKSISFYINGLVEKDKNGKEGYVLSDNFSTDELLNL